ncbi:MAG TPA: protein kinase [Steroidobacteraceae bacterium]|jgi:serine/threonine protein kinase|nr:protein kinase [Steroidobacteraceae bacterium]
MTETEIWSKWESQVVNGVFPLRRFLGRSNHSVVFLTDCKAQKLASAAIKIVPADPARAETQLSRWRMVAALSHPHLIRVLEAGRCKLGGHPFLFVVTEYAEQNLAQILPHRALTADEVREMLLPALDALAFLHRQNLVQGQLKAPNFLVVNDQLKLASDTIRAVGETAGVDTARDVLELGATVVEALTQMRPALDNPAAPALPAALSPGLAAALRRCLSPDPHKRPTVSELRDQIDPKGAALPPPEAAPPGLVPAVPVAPQSAPEVSTPAASAPAPPTPSNATTPAPAPAVARRPAPNPKRQAPWVIPAAAVGLVFVALWIGTRVLRSHSYTGRPTAHLSVSLPAASPAATQSATVAPAASPVLHEQIPAVSRGSRASIHGQVKVAVRVSVDRAGNVVAENLEVRGSSRYFARLATDAAKKWKFVPADNPNAREWLLEFEFSRDGVTGQAVPRVRQ